MRHAPPLPGHRTAPTGRRLPAVCRPAGWVAIWRKIGAFSILSCRKGASAA
ncbi:hypothetical protein ACFP8Z_05750 [Gemmobacter lanyuensis]|uniref:hypothetical protein n=1 Tax=Gemmobacter lanyuensis TaxID=1054497 RepID=UPI001672ECD6|nr:hypothetical protein [Gemmobacter lanyuensis]